MDGLGTSGTLGLTVMLDPMPKLENRTGIQQQRPSLGNLLIQISEIIMTIRRCKKPQSSVWGVDETCIKSLTCCDTPLDLVWKAPTIPRTNSFCLRFVFSQNKPLGRLPKMLSKATALCEVFVERAHEAKSHTTWTYAHRKTQGQRYYRQASFQHITSLRDWSDLGCPITQGWRNNDML